MQYRPEIDGLRAVAVMPVLLFHAGFSAFSGGYIGVDVFFVISGYLITSIVAKEMKEGEFSLSRFYERRARRILPPLIITLAVSIALAWYLLTPADMRLFGRSVLAVAVFGSNVVFWRESGYFDSAAEFKPLLHTWSLGVEEQYYVVFPLMLMVLWRFGPRSIIGALAALLTGSLMLADWMVGRSPGAAFFLLPTRAWELGAGSILAIYLAGKPPKLPALTANVLAVAGAGMLAIAIVAYDASTPFPGFPALLPTAGAVLLIWAATPETAVGRLLSCKPVVLVGLISYSTYLFHQPLFAFTRHALVDGAPVAAYVVLIGTSLGLGYLSWRFLEAPFRNPSVVKLPALLAFCTGGSLLAAVFGAVAYGTGGLPIRHPEQAAYLAHFENSLPDWRYFEANSIQTKYRDDCNFYDTAAYRAGRATSLPRPELSDDCTQASEASSKLLLIWGDSHAQQFRPGLDRHQPGDWTILQVAASACRPRLDNVGAAYCVRSNNVARETISQQKPEVVLLAQSDGYDDLPNLQQLVNWLRLNGVKRILLVGPVPRWKRDLPVIVALKLWPAVPPSTSIGLDETYFEQDRNLRAAFARQPDVTYASPLSFLCPSRQECSVYLGSDPVRGATTWDYGHLTPVASEAFADNVLRPILEGTRREPSVAVKSSGRPTGSN